MRCRLARHLMAAADGDSCKANQQLALEVHLSNCASCREFCAALARLNGELDNDALAGSAPMSEGFYERLGIRLVLINSERERTPIDALDRLVIHAIGAIPLPARAVVYSVIAAVLIAVVLMSPTGLMPAPRTAALDYNPRHLASLSVERAPDGRIYASLGASTAPARASVTEVLQ